jgi:hypothetical protein
LLSGTSADFSTGQYGGAGVAITRGLMMDQMYLKTSDLVFTDTKVDYYARTTDTNGNAGSFLPVVANSDNLFASRMMIPSYENYNLINGVKDAPVQVKAVLSSSNPNISPVIDLQQISGFATANLINNPSSSLNVATIDTRDLIKYGDIVTADTQSSGTGGIFTSATNSTAVVGYGTLFRTQVFAGNKIYRDSDDTLIGTVASIQDDTHLTLTGNAAIAITNTGTNSTPFIVETNPTLTFANNSAGYGKISTTIDTADNLLSSASVGKVLIISGVTSGIDGTYNITDVQVVEDRTVYAGNVEGDIVSITLDRAFGTTSSLNMITDANGDFKISILDKYVDDTAPYGATNNANYITRTLSLAEPAEVLKVMFDANIPNSTEIKVYYRTWTGNDVDLKKLKWTDSGFISQAKDVGTEFVEREVTVTGIPSYNNVQIKVVFKSTVPVKVPKIKNLRVLALT